MTDKSHATVFIVDDYAGLRQAIHDLALACVLNPLQAVRISSARNTHAARAA
jgi:hypothetical protein